MRLTKLTTTSITAARPSMYTPIGNEPPWPRFIQLTENSMGAPPPGTMPATNSKEKTEKTREMVTPRMAKYWAFSFSRRPARTSTRKTRAGSVGMAVMISCWPTVCTGLPLAPHRGYLVHVHGPPRAEHGEHDGEPDCDLRRGYGYNEHGVADAESPGVRQVVCEGDEREVDAVYHELDAHEDDDGVAADHDDGRHDGDEEEHRGDLEEQGEDLGPLADAEQISPESADLARPVASARPSPVLGGEYVGQEGPDADGHKEARPELAIDYRAVAPDLRLLGEHDPEQDHHRYRTDVDEDLERGERGGVEHHEVPRDTEERPRHKQRRVDDAAAEHDTERRDQRHPGQKDERDRQAAPSFSVTGRSTVLGAFLVVAFFFFFTVGFGSTVGSTGRSPNCLARSRRL